MFLKRIQPFIYLGIYYVVLSLVLRLILVFSPFTSPMNTLQVTKSILLGMLNDGFTFVIFSGIFVLYTFFLSEAKYKRPGAQILLTLSLLAIAFLSLNVDNILRFRSSFLGELLLYFLAVKTVIFFFMLLLSKEVRLFFRKFFYFLTILCYTLFIPVSLFIDYFFFSQSGHRVDHTSFDYFWKNKAALSEACTQWTQSHLWLILIAGILILGLAFFIHHKTRNNLNHLPSMGEKMSLLATYLVLLIVSLLAGSLTQNLSEPDDKIQQIERNGLFQILQSYSQNPTPMEHLIPGQEFETE